MGRENFAAVHDEPAGASREFRAPQWRRLLVLRVAAVGLVLVLAGFLFPDDSRKGLFLLIVGGIYLPVSVGLHLSHRENPRPPSVGWFVALLDDTAAVSLVLALFPAVTVLALLALTLIVIVNAQFFGSRWGMAVGVVAWAGVLAPTVVEAPGGAGTFEAVLAGPLLVAVGFVVGTLADDERRAAGRSRRLAEAIASVGSSLDLREVLSGLCLAACRVLGGRFAVVLSREEGSLNFVSGVGEPVLEEAAAGVLDRLLDGPELSDAPTLRALATGEAVFVRDTEQDGVLAVQDPLARLAGVRSLAAVPIEGDGRPVAVLIVYLPRPHRFTADEREFLAAIARHAAIAMERGSVFSRERETADRLRELDRLKSEFVATVSHELRTPLTGIVGFALTLRNRWRDLDDALRDELLDRVDQNARSLEHLITHLLDFSRLERGQFRVAIAPQDAPALVRAVLRNMAYELGSHPVHVEAPPSLGVMSDPYGFERILGNLLSNAAKFTPSGTPIDVRLQAAGGFVRLSVSDHGPGIPREHMDRIFERFFRGSPGAVRGAGIGLTVVKELVELQGGRVQARNASPGPGAVFTVWLPRAILPERGDGDAISWGAGSGGAAAPAG